MSQEVLDTTSQRTTNGKALRINLDPLRYGTFAEIGAGQEVARHFFLAGKASQTVAKTMSAYDMTFSDEIYGKEKSGRYVCESRVYRMLEKEYSLLERRLADKRGTETCFFAFADTVATGTPETPRTHGWLGIRFQQKPKGQVNDIVLHVRMGDKHRLQQQETLGILGVNLVHAAFYHSQDPAEFIDFLLDNIKPGQVYFDMIKFSGPDLKKMNTRWVNLELVRRGWAEAAMFAPNGEVVSIADAVWGKSLVIERGAFRPVTNTHLEVMRKGVEEFRRLLKERKDKSEILPLFEILMPASTTAKEIDDFDRRLENLQALGEYSVVTNFHLYYQLKRFFRKITQAPMALVMAASKLELVFEPSHYRDLEGGILEGLGKLIDENTLILVYPHKTDRACLTAKNFRPHKNVQHLYDHFREGQFILDISGCDEASSYWHSEDVAKMIRKKDKTWEKLVPAEVQKSVANWLK
ncbi:MAG: hypothetical protein N2578_01565 [Bdellovibrionaceae bacterium]|nr:hypothetical protein [Pseudobdellovibrionaceae bacterium]